MNTLDLFVVPLKILLVWLVWSSFPQALHIISSFVKHNFTGSHFYLSRRFVFTVFSTSIPIAIVSALFVHRSHHLHHLLLS